MLECTHWPSHRLIYTRKAGFWCTTACDQPCATKLLSCCKKRTQSTSLYCACREMGHLSSLPGLLRTQANIQKPLPRQKISNLLAALDSLYLLLAPIPQQAGSLLGKPEVGNTRAFTASLHSYFTLLHLLSMTPLSILLPGCSGHLIQTISPPEHVRQQVLRRSSCFMTSGHVKSPLCLQDVTSKAQQQQPDKVGTQITLLKAGCLEALLHLSAASSVIIRSQVPSVNL